MTEVSRDIVHGYSLPILIFLQVCKWDNSACSEETEGISLHLCFICERRMKRRRVCVYPLGTVKTKSLRSQAQLHVLCAMFTFIAYPENTCEVAFPYSSSLWLTLLFF